MIPVEIHAFTLADKSACLEIFNSNVPEFFTPGEQVVYEDWLSRLCENEFRKDSEGEMRYFVAALDGLVIGCGGWGIRAGAGHATLVWGAVHRDFHKQGIGQVLTDFRIDDFRRHHPMLPMTIDTSHLTAPFYERFGFVTETFTENGYAAGLHRHDMRLM